MEKTEDDLVPAIVRDVVGDRKVLWLINNHVERLLDMGSAIEALRASYLDLKDGNATYIPRVDLFVPTGRSDDYHQWGSMAGASMSAGVVAVRMKSDIATWPGGQTWEKHCIADGTFCGLVFLFSSEDGAPVCVMQDGYIQHVRVGAAAGIGADLLARRDATTLGLLGSGGMARSYLIAISHVRPLEHVSVFSPTASHRESFAKEMAEELGIEVTPVRSAEEAVRSHDIVATATDSAGPTFDQGWVAPGTHVTCVTRRELGKDLIERADRVVQLGTHSLPRTDVIPELSWTGGGIASYISGTEEERSRIPKSKPVSEEDWPSFIEVQRNVAFGRTSDKEVTLFVTTGTQGLQFAAVGSLVWRRALEQGVGWTLPLTWFIQDVRD